MRLGHMVTLDGLLDVLTFGDFDINNTDMSICVKIDFCLNAIFPKAFHEWLSNLDV